MQRTHVAGTDKGEILIYTLSTCIWCRKLKAFLHEQGVAYDYIDVDLLVGEERNQVQQEVLRWNPGLSFPTMIIHGKTCIVGFNETKVREEIGL